MSAFTELQSNWVFDCPLLPAQSGVLDHDLVSYYSMWIGRSEVIGVLQNNSKMCYRTRHSFGWPEGIACPLRGTRPWPIYWPFTTRRQLHRSWQTTAGRWPFASFPTICHISVHLHHFLPFASFPSIWHISAWPGTFPSAGGIKSKRSSAELQFLVGERLKSLRKLSWFEDKTS